MMDSQDFEKLAEKNRSYRIGFEDGALGITGACIQGINLPEYRKGHSAGSEYLQDCKRHNRPVDKQALGVEEFDAAF